MRLRSLLSAAALTSITLGLAGAALADGGARTPRAVAGASLRAAHRGDGAIYAVARRPVYDVGGLSVWPMIVNGRRNPSAVLIDGASPASRWRSAPSA